MRDVIACRCGADIRIGEAPGNTFVALDATPQPPSINPHARRWAMAGGGRIVPCTRAVVSWVQHTCHAAVTIAP